MAICQPCTEGDHARCDDVQREARYEAWTRTLVSDKKNTTLEDRATLIEANRPYASCPCQHRTITREESAT